MGGGREGGKDKDVPFGQGLIPKASRQRAPEQAIHKDSDLHDPDYGSDVDLFLSTSG